MREKILLPSRFVMVLIICLAGCSSMTLGKAVYNGDIPTTQKLLKEGADVNQIQNEKLGVTFGVQQKILTLQREIVINGRTPLMIAVYSGNAIMIRFLLKNGALVNAQSWDGETPLTLAASRFPDTIPLLLKAGANVNQKDLHGETALLTLIANTGSYQANTGRLLIKYGADINIKNSNGDTALILAAETKKSDYVKVLLKANADINIRNNDGNTALILAAENGNTKIVQLLLKAGADVNIRNNDGNTALILAAANNHSNSVRILMEHGADVNEKNMNGLTAFNVALQYRSSDIVALLEASRLKKAKKAEANGNIQKAFREYLKILKFIPEKGSVSSGSGPCEGVNIDDPGCPGSSVVSSGIENPFYTKVLKRLLRVAHALRPYPIPSESYRKEMVMGLFYIKKAKTDKDFTLAFDHFSKASRKAPWIPQTYEALGRVEESLKNYRKSEIYYRFYLLASPNAKNARSIQDHIYELEAKAKGN